MFEISHLVHFHTVSPLSCSIKADSKMNASCSAQSQSSALALLRWLGKFSRPSVVTDVLLQSFKIEVLT
jgi:hypothetical protein